MKISEDIFGSIQDAISEALDITKNEITINSSINEYSNWDSHGYVAVIISLSKKFDCSRKSRNSIK